MKSIFVIVFVFAFSALSAQSLSPASFNSGTAGGQAGSVRLSYSIGQAVVPVFKQGNALTQGFWQPRLIKGNIQEESPVSVQLSVYPNPTRDNLFVKILFAEKIEGKITLTAYDSFGKEVSPRIEIHQNPQTTQQNVHLNLQKLPAGHYFFRLFLNNKPLANFKAIKN